MTPVRPKKAYGQHFLTDRNVLGVIGRLAGLAPEDVVLEVGPGLGVLTEYLAARVRHVHAVEIDRTLEGSLQPVTEKYPNVALTWGDALELDLRTLDPPPAKLVANLPYNIATPLIVETLVQETPLVSYCVMVQREVADRLFAVPGSKAYGAVSVALALTAQRTGFHPVSRHVFRPPPRVESALVAFDRVVPPPRLLEIRRLVDAAFSHRRKTLPNSVEHHGLHPRERVGEALATLGLPPTVRAEALTPAQFVELERALA